jgi:hypothetical protein
MNLKKIFVGVALGSVIFYLLTSFIIDRRLAALESTLMTNIDTQIQKLSNTAALLGRGGSSEVVANIVPECASLDVARYDSLLSLLDRGLSAAELTELKTLFDRCGDIASMRRAVMTITLDDEVKTLALLVSHYNSLGKHFDPETLVKDWEELVVLEKDISNYFKQLVVAQGNIIEALVSNTPSSALTVENIRVQAESVQTKLTELTAAAAPLRSRLIKS